MIISAVAILVFIVGSTTAIILEQQFKFDKQFLSELGVRVTPSDGAGSKLKTAYFPEVFNITLIVTGILMSPFFVGVYITLKPEKTIQKLIFTGTAVSGVFSGITLALVGIFDLGYFYYPHMTVTALFYAGTMFTCFLWCVGILLLEKTSPYKQSKHWIGELVMSLVTIGIGIINSTYTKDYINELEFISEALCQKIFVYSVFILMTLVIIRFFRIVRRERIEKTLALLP